MLKESTEQLPPVYKIAVKCDGKQYWLEWFCRDDDYVGRYFDFMLDTGRKDDLEYLSQKEVYTLDGLHQVLEGYRKEACKGRKVYVPKHTPQYVPLSDVAITPVMALEFVPVVEDTVDSNVEEK